MHRHGLRSDGAADRHFDGQRHHVRRQPRAAPHHAHIHRLQHHDARIRVQRVVLPLPAVPMRNSIVRQPRRKLDIARNG